MLNRTLIKNILTIFIFIFCFYLFLFIFYLFSVWKSIESVEIQVFNSFLLCTKSILFFCRRFKCSFFPSLNKDKQINPLLNKTNPVTYFIIILWTKLKNIFNLKNEHFDLLDFQNTLKMSTLLTSLSVAYFLLLPSCELRSLTFSGQKIVLFE